MGRKEKTLKDILLETWESRKDLQAAFPGYDKNEAVTLSDGTNFLAWAKKYGIKESKEIKAYFKKHPKERA